MNKKDLINQVREKLSDCTPLEVKTAIDLFFDTLAEHLAQKGRIELRGFGNFSIRHRPSYTGSNPQTQERFIVKAKYVPIFKMSSVLKEELINKKNKQKNTGKRNFFSIIYKDFFQSKHSF